MEVKTKIEIFNFKIFEPATLITDLMITAFCVIAVYYLIVHNKLTFHHSIILFFGIFGLSTLFGGLSHGLFSYKPNTFDLIAWSLSAIGLFFLEYYFINTLTSKKIKLVLTIIILLKLAITIGGTLLMKTFLISIINFSGGLLLIVLTIALFNYLNCKDQAYLYIIFGVLINILPAIIHLKKISLSVWFNHNDISHLILILSLWLLFIGLKSLTAPPPEV